MHMDEHILLTIGKTIADQVAGKIRQTKNLGLLTQKIGKGGDATKHGDQVVEDALRVIVPTVMKQYHFSGCLIISEETGQWKVGDISDEESIFMIIDPIDGSNNMRPHSTPKPFVGFSIGLGSMSDLLTIKTFDAITAGVIEDIFHNEQYVAQRGGGAFLGDLRLKVSPLEELSETVLGTSLDRRGNALQKILDKGLTKLLLATKCQRRIGSTALDLCRVASGDYDAYVSLSGDVKVHDIAAAKLIVEEAGGVFDLYKNNNNVSSEPWLYDLYQKGDGGIKEISFEVLVSGTSLLSRSITQLVYS
jgi:myo-inositol-1(or 4)-monophosphatase